MSLLIQFMVICFACAARVAQRKIDGRLMELAAVAIIAFICLYIEAVKGLVCAAYGAYEAGRTLRRWWDNATSPSPAPVGVTVMEQALLEGFSPAGLLTPAPAPVSTEEVTVMEQALLEGFSPAGLLTPAPAPVSTEEVTAPLSNVVELGRLTVLELKALAKSRGLRGYSKLRKSELIALLLG